jgi:hypothetical protein
LSAIWRAGASSKTMNGSCSTAICRLRSWPNWLAAGAADPQQIPCAA